MTWSAGIDLLPIIYKPHSLDGLSADIDGMHSKQQVILGCHGKGISHQQGRADDESASHASGNTTSESVFHSGSHYAGVLEMNYISGSFRISVTAAMGMPKLEAGPQKSRQKSMEIVLIGKRGQNIRVEQK
jgi:hypothetical protein